MTREFAFTIARLFVISMAVLTAVSFARTLLVPSTQAGGWTLPWSSVQEKDDVVVGSLLNPLAAPSVAPKDGVPPDLFTLADGARAQAAAWRTWPTAPSDPLRFLKDAFVRNGFPFDQVKIQREGASRAEFVMPAEWGVDADGIIRRIDGRSARSVAQGFALVCAFLAAMLTRFVLVRSLARRGWSEARDPGPFRLAEAVVFMGVVVAGMACGAGWPADWTDWTLLAVCAGTFFMGARTRWRTVLLTFAAIMTARALQVAGVAPAPELASAYGAAGLYGWEMFKLSVLALFAINGLVAVPSSRRQAGVPGADAAA